MAKTGAFWDKSPNEFIGSVNASVYELTRKRALKIFEIAVKLSPVDSGAYRASWNISENQPEFIYAGKPVNVGEILQPPSTPKLSTKFYRKFYITNGAPYAMRIENGWSDQAPQGVLRQAIRESAK